MKHAFLLFVIFFAFTINAQELALANKDGKIWIYLKNWRMVNSTKF